MSVSRGSFSKYTCNHSFSALSSLLPQLFAFLISKQEENRKKKKVEQVGGSNRNHEALEQVVEYCMTPHCRRQYVLKHFGEKETDPKTVCQKCCDYCSNPSRVEQAIQSSEAMRVITFQKKEEAKKKKKAKQWDGQWDKPHGDDEFFEGHKEDWEVDGLGITSSAKAKPSFLGTKTFVSAKTLASKLDSLEVRIWIWMRNEDYSQLPACFFGRSRVGCL